MSTTEAAAADVHWNGRPWTVSLHLAPHGRWAVAVTPHRLDTDKPGRPLPAGRGSSGTNGHDVGRRQFEHHVVTRGGASLETTTSPA